MATTDDFSFPSMTNIGRDTISLLTTTTLWRISSCVSSYEDVGGGSIGGSVMSDLEAAEEKMDWLWEDLNDELGGVCGYMSAGNYSPVGGGGGSANHSKMEGPAAKGCNTVVAYGKMNGAGRKRARVIGVLKKLLLLHGVVHKFRRK